MRIRVTNRPSLTLLEPKIRSARLRRGCSMLRMKKAHEKMESRAGPHEVASPWTIESGFGRRLGARCFSAYAARMAWQQHWEALNAVCHRV